MIWAIYIWETLSLGNITCAKSFDSKEEAVNWCNKCNYILLDLTKTI
jgi:hypothetical protein